MSNLTEHKCDGKCPEFKGDQCHHCLIQQIEKREFELGVAIEDAYVNIGDDAHIENHISPHCRINCFQDDTTMGTRTVDIEAENERLKTENIAMQAEIDLLKEALDIKESLNNALRARDEARQSMLINGGEV